MRTLLLVAGLVSCLAHANCTTDTSCTTQYPELEEFTEYLEQVAQDEIDNENDGEVQAGQRGEL